MACTFFKGQAQPIKGVRPDRGRVFEKQWIWIFKLWLRKLISHNAKSVTSFSMIYELCSEQLRIKITKGETLVCKTISEQCAQFFFWLLRYRFCNGIVLQDCTVRFPSSSGKCLRDQKSKHWFLEVEEYVNQTIEEIWKRSWRNQANPHSRKISHAISPKPQLFFRWWRNFTKE